MLDAFHTSDSRALHLAYLAAVKEELEGLLSRGVFRLVDKRDLLAKTNLLTGRSMRFIKNVGTPYEKLKARLFVQGHVDAENSLLVHDSATIRQSSLSILLSLASSFKLNV